ncbi:hypothetical protein [Halomonas sp. YLGW01]|uniref:hypothetical protein n=1 Tax=Halomonas sp. YLGW01 TaxID=2773308 RepID=UPI001783914A|nr:hypothetical protein [Halomonas sp. YLGW01]
MFPTDSRRQVAHETINNALDVMPRGSLKKELFAWLQQGSGKRRSMQSRVGSTQPDS